MDSSNSLTIPMSKTCRSYLGNDESHQEDREDQQAEDRARAGAPRFEFPQRVTEDITQVVNAANQATTASTQATTAATGVARAAAQVIQDIPSYANPCCEENLRQNSSKAVSRGMPLLSPSLKMNPHGSLSRRTLKFKRRHKISQMPS